MYFAKFAQTAAVVGLVIAAVWGQPHAAQAQEIVVESRGETAIDHGVTVLAWARVDGVSPADEDHDILFDPADDLLPPAKPVGNEEPTPAFDGRLLTAGDLTRE